MLLRGRVTILQKLAGVRVPFFATLLNTYQFMAIIARSLSNITY